MNLDENRAAYIGYQIAIFEHPNPACELVDKESGSAVAIRSIEDAKAVIDSLTRFIKSCEKEYAA